MPNMAPTNLQEDWQNFAFGRRSTWLISACLFECEEDQKFDDIRALGLDAKSKDQNQTPLLGLAIELELFRVVEFLMTNGVDTGATDCHGNTILHMLATCKNKEIIMMVKSMWRQEQNGWLPLNDSEHTPIEDSIYQENEPVIQALLDELIPSDFKDKDLLHLAVLAVTRNFTKGLEALYVWKEKYPETPSLTLLEPHEDPLDEILQHMELLFLTVYPVCGEVVCQDEIKNLKLIPALARCGKLEMVQVAWTRLNGQ